MVVVVQEQKSTHLEIDRSVQWFHFGPSRKTVNEKTSQHANRIETIRNNVVCRNGTLDITEHYKNTLHSRGKLRKLPGNPSKTWPSMWVKDLLSWFNGTSANNISGAVHIYYIFSQYSVSPCHWTIEDSIKPVKRVRLRDEPERKWGPDMTKLTPSGVKDKTWKVGPEDNDREP